MTIALVVGGLLALGALAAIFPHGPSRRVILAADSGIAARKHVKQDGVFAVAQPRQPLGHFTDQVNTRLFSPDNVSAGAAPPARPQGSVIAAPPPMRPTESPSDWSDGLIFSGMARIGGAVIALVENPRTRQGRFIRVGEAFGGGSVLSITPETITVRVEGKVERLARNKNYSLTPLNRSADFLTAKPATTTVTSKTQLPTQQPANGAVPAVPVPSQPAAVVPPPAPSAEPQASPAEKLPLPDQLPPMAR